MKFFKKSDLIIIFVIIAVAGGLFYGQDVFFKEEGTRAEVYYYSELLEVIDLEADRGKEIALEKNPNVILKVDDQGGIAFLSSDCPDKLCVKTGRMHRVGEYAACLPNGIIVKLVKKGAGSPDDADIIVQ